MANVVFETPINFNLGSVYDVATSDFDGDGNLDIVTVGNVYDISTYSYRGTVSLLLGDGE